MESKDSNREPKAKSIFNLPVTTLPDMERLLSLLRGKGRSFYALKGLLGSARAMVLFSLGAFSDKKIIILPGESDARRLYDEYRFYDRDCRYYPAKDFLFYNADIKSNELTTERIRVIHDILGGERITVFTTIEALLTRLPAAPTYRSNGITLQSGDTIDLSKLSESLVNMGYDHSPMVSTPGEYSIRGGIIDVFPLTEVLPLRIELFDDEIDTIRRFDPDTQKSIDPADSVTLFPATEYETVEENVSTLPEYFPEDALFFLDDPVRLYDQAKAAYLEYEDAMRGRYGDSEAYKSQMSHVSPPEDIFSSIQDRKGLILSGLDTDIPPIKYKEVFHIKSNPLMNFNGSIPLLKKELASYREKGFRVVICGQSRTRQNRLCEGLIEDGIDCFYSETPGELSPGNICITMGALNGGVEFPEGSLVYISENDIFGGTYARKRKRAYKKGDAIESFRDLSPGDYVIHENYGLGIYRGIEKIEQDGIVKDFLKISYAKSDNLYVPVSQLDIISKYSGGGEGVQLKLASLSGEEWKKTKSRVKAAVSDMAKELAELYALRQQERGYAYGPDTSWQQEFEEMFPYEETEGQLAAIEDVKSDLCSNKIMDRLICGDVGFGKTEVALRAAFKVVQEGKQVVILVPTTVLAGQHFETFTARMKPYPVKVGLLSRFRTPVQNKETVRMLKSGEMDIVIGTHRALSEDVSFKNLGLLVIDEEQRFGVRHKEKIKQIRNQVDVLSLSATPIPRTLHMSLIGVRDMSLLNDAPVERLPVQTFVFEQNDEMIREAIERELSREGQVYYVVNRIRQIPEIVKKIEELVPRARVVSAHGRMNENSLEDIMNDFVEKTIDVLVATTIIEIGLDIPNVNTIIIHDADDLGLSQLYQLRGRVGRSNRTAYAFLMYRRDKFLKEVAQKRLTAIREFSELGSGFKIAMQDLEIRGAGNLLGSEQHGHMEAVGYDLYCKMLSLAIKEEKGEYSFPDFETAIDIQLDAFIPESFIPDEAQKLEIYKRIALISDDEGELQITDELIDRFGEPPKSVINLIHISRLRELAHRTFIGKIHQNNDTVKVDIYPRAELDPTNIPLLVESYGKSMRFVPDPQSPGLFVKIPQYKKNMDILPFLTELVENIRKHLL